MKAYTTCYRNKQFYQNKTTVILPSLASPSGVDKLNGYRHAGMTPWVVSYESRPWRVPRRRLV